MNVRVLIGSKKGAFILESDGGAAIGACAGHSASTGR